MDNKELRILYVDDDVENQQDLRDVLSGKLINEQAVTLDCESDFEGSVDKSREYHIVILDLYKGEATKGGEDVGSDILDKVKNKFFVPVIFYSGNINGVKDQRSQVVGVASKGENIETLVNEIKRLSKQNLPFLKNNVHAYIEEEFKKYFWGVIHKENDKFTPDAEDFSLGYMLLRNIADSLSKENIKNIIGDDTIKGDKVHPMEFYIYPIDSSKEFENGEILEEKESHDVYVILTPSCDFIKRRRGNEDRRNVDKVLLINTKLLNECKEYEDYKSTQNKDNKSNLEKLINSSKGDRYFFLPQAPFIENRIVDFQRNYSVTYDELKSKFERIAKLDSPFVQSMTACFIRYYNRIGFPDIDTEYVIKHLEV